MCKNLLTNCTRENCIFSRSQYSMVSCAPSYSIFQVLPKIFQRWKYKILSALMVFRSAIQISDLICNIKAVKPIRSMYSAVQPITSSQSEWLKLIGSCGPISCQPATTPSNYQHTTKVCLHFSPIYQLRKSCTLSIS